jgi:hypothetical protein
MFLHPPTSPHGFTAQRTNIDINVHISLIVDVGGRGRPKNDSTEGEKTQSFPCIMRCETVTFRLQKYRNGRQL